MAECRGELSLNASVAINAKGGDCWKIQLTDNECLSLMATVKMTGKQKTSSER
jgi:hypothetical protein